jgi:phage tail sheath protein FI
MTTAVATTPGLYLTLVPRPAQPSPLRSDVAGFIGHTKRGPVGQAVRVEGWRNYLRIFGGLIGESDTPWAIRGYFENGGEVAWVVRLFQPEPRAFGSTPDGTAQAIWKVAEPDALTGRWTASGPAKGGFTAFSYLIQATSPGVWANGLRVLPRYRLEGVANLPEVDLTIYAQDEPVEYLTGLRPRELVERVNSASALIRLTPLDPPPVEPHASDPPGRRSIEWNDLPSLRGGSEAPHTAAWREQYLAAITALGDQPEVALTALPDLHRDAGDDEETAEILAALLQQAAELHDRLLLIDLPRERQSANCALEWVAQQLPQGDAALLRGGAVYHPHLWVPNPLGGIAEPLRRQPPSGHVAGVISRLDRERGAHHTPANAPLFEAVDVTATFAELEQARCNEAGINLLRCFPGRGLQVWGGRTPDREQTGRFVAHRRLIHRLVRAIRRVAEPLVFDTNGPELWLAFVRAITTVLLEAWRAGALKGTRPAEAFRVQCDEQNNPPAAQELGRVLCEIELAPAAPMEFIHLRVALGSDGKLEVFEP